MAQSAIFECFWCAQTTHVVCAHAGARSFFSRGFMKTCACCILRGGASAATPMVYKERKTALGSVSLAERDGATCPTRGRPASGPSRRHRTEKLLHVAWSLEESKHAPDARVEKWATRCTDECQVAQPVEQLFCNSSFCLFL